METCFYCTLHLNFSLRVQVKSKVNYAAGVNSKKGTSFASSGVQRRAGELLPLLWKTLAASRSRRSEACLGLGGV